MSPTSTTGIAATRPDRRNLPGEARDHEGVTLPRPDVVEGPREPDIHSLGDGPLPAQRLGRDLAHRVGIARRRRPRLGDRQLSLRHEPVDVAGADEHHRPGEATPLQRLQQVQRAEKVDGQRRLRIAKRLGDVADRRQVQHRIGGRRVDDVARLIGVAKIQLDRNIGELPI